MTPARLDLMFFVHTQSGLGIAQRDLRRGLGVSAPTVSRMLRSLETLGLVVRTPVSVDRRQRWVQLTALGHALVRRARKRLLRRTVPRWVATLVAPRGPAFPAMEAVDDILGRMRRGLLDVATHYYRWHPDD